MFKKPNTKTITGVATRAGAFVIGAKVGDGLNAVMPDSIAPYKRWGIGIGAIVIAAFISPSTTIAQASQDALLGMGAKQLYDELSETLAGAIPVKVSGSPTSKFVNAVVGHSDIAIQPALGASWQGETSDMWSRNEEVQLLANNFTGV